MPTARAKPAAESMKLSDETMNPVINHTIATDIEFLQGEVMMG